jgi:hypothetical protein
MQRGMFRLRQVCVGLNYLRPRRKQRMIAVCSIESVVTVRSTAEETNCYKLAQFVLNSMQRQTRFVSQFTYVMLFRWRIEEQLQHFGPDLWKYYLQNCPLRLRHERILNLTV